LPPRVGGFSVENQADVPPIVVLHTFGERFAREVPISTVFKLFPRKLPAAYSFWQWKQKKGKLGAGARKGGKLQIIPIVSSVSKAGVG